MGGGDGREVDAAGGADVGGPGVEVVLVLGDQVVGAVGLEGGGGGEGAALEPAAGGVDGVGLHIGPEDVAGGRAVVGLEVALGDET